MELEEGMIFWDTSDKDYGLIIEIDEDDAVNFIYHDDLNMILQARKSEDYEDFPDDFYDYDYVKNKIASGEFQLITEKKEKISKWRDEIVL